MNNKIRLLIFLIILTPVLSVAQDECKVLLPALDSLYKGSCKNGLAHGKGEAWGDFHYKGNFKKGYPHGKGIAVYPDSLVYNGYWKKGLRNGKGTISHLSDDVREEKIWIWRDDEKVREIVPSDYKIITKRNVERLRIYDEGGRSGVWFIPKSQGGLIDQYADMRILGDSGSQVKMPQRIGYENVTFPFRGSIKYYAWNKLRSMQYEIFVEIEVNKPGNWVVEIHN